MLGLMRLHVEQAGDGAAVLLLHSSGFSGRQWKRLAAELVERGMRAVVPDLTGHGGSEPWPPPRPFRFEVDVEEVAALLRELGSAHVVSHSYGGLIALHVALAEPGAIRSLHLFDPVAFGVLDPVADRDARQVLVDHDLSGDDERWLRTFVDFWGGAGTWEGLREPVRAEFRRVAWVVRQGVESLLFDTTPLAAYRALRGPVHLMTGERSPLPARRVGQRLVEAIDGARLDVVAGAGHLAPVTQPAEVNRLVVEAIAASERR
jgi:pimeloyl-ACP methyl ester carboxylesterase